MRNVIIVLCFLVVSTASPVLGSEQNDRRMLNWIIYSLNDAQECLRYLLPVHEYMLDHGPGIWTNLRTQAGKDKYINCFKKHTNPPPHHYHNWRRAYNYVGIDGLDLFQPGGKYHEYFQEKVWEATKSLYDANNSGSVVCSERYCHCKQDLHCDDGLYCSDNGWCDNPAPKEQRKATSAEEPPCTRDSDCPGEMVCKDDGSCVEYQSDPTPKGYKNN